MLVSLVYGGWRVWQTIDPGMFDYDDPLGMSAELVFRLVVFSLPVMMPLATVAAVVWWVVLVRVYGRGILNWWRSTG